MGNGQSAEREEVAQKNFVTFKINGKQYIIQPSQENICQDTRLVDFIRDHANLKGTKYMCREGGCGICVVSVKSRDVNSGDGIVVRGVNSCLVPILACDGWEITTIENLGNHKDGLHPIQQRFVKFHGTQCGYCTPGWIMNAYSVSKATGQRLRISDIENCIDGNYCRCTGYRPIVDALTSLARDAPEDLLRLNGIHIEDQKELSACEQSCSKGSGTACCSVLSAPESIYTGFENGEQWAKAVNMETLFLAIQRFQNAGLKFKIVAGNTGSGVYKRDGPYLACVEINSVDALHKNQLTQSSLIIGGAVTISTALKILEQQSSMDGFQYFKTVCKHWRRVANISVRNLGSLGGNLMLKHTHREFPSDIFLVLETIGAMVTVASSTTLQEMHTIQEFLNVNMEGKIIYSIHLPKIQNSPFHSFKIARRYQNAHAYVNAGFLLDIDMNKLVIRTKPSVVYGGISPDFIHASKTEDFLNGKKLNTDTLQGAMATLEEEIQPTVAPLEGHPAYRKGLAKSLLYKAILKIMGNQNINPKFISGGSVIEKKLTHAKRNYKYPETEWPLYQAVPKLEAPLQVSGEAEYTNDIPPCLNELHGAVVLATVGKAMLKLVDFSQALKYPGVVGWVDAKDITGEDNYMAGLGIEPDPIFVQDNKVIRYAGEPIGAIIAKTRHAALSALALVKVEYSSMEKPIIDIPNALAKASREGNLDGVAQERFVSQKRSSLKAPHSIKGEFKVPTQIHMPTEPMVSICIPRDECMDVHCSTQYVTHVQNAVATALGWPCNTVNVFTRRLGGAFGLKIARAAHLATICALACNKFRQPVRMYMDMESSISMHGKRQPHLFNYEVGFDDNGKILHLTHNYFDDVGCTANEDTGFVTVWGFQSCYNADGWKATKNIVKTDLAPNTFCRAPALVKATACTETIMDQIAWYLKKDPMEVRVNNFIKKGDIRFPQNDLILSENRIPDILKEMTSSADLLERQNFVEKFNTANRWKKRGIAIMPTRTPVHYLFSDYKVYVAVYGHDGTVAVCHSGVEMGQGINTKVAQVVARGLRVPLEKVKIKPPDSFKGANATLTGTSITSEHVCHAAWKACQILKERLDSVKDKVKDPTWENVAAYCRQNGMDLTAYGCTTYEDKLQTYDLYSLTISEVEIDCLTGEYRIVRTDLTTDIGYAISPDIDIGQIEGAFVMGLGYFLQEKAEYNEETGELLTNRTWNYKPPFAKDLPEDFRLNLVQNAPNPYGVLRSKTTSEPPLMLSFSVVLALRRAITAARMDAGNMEWFKMDPPITPEAVHTLCLTDGKQFSL